MADLNKIIDELSTLTVVEAAELSKQLEEKWGVTAAAPVAAAPAGGAAAPAGEEKTEFSLFLAKELTSEALALSIIEASESNIKRSKIIDYVTKNYSWLNFSNDILKQFGIKTSK